jgi:hypothetical protein
MASCGSFPLGCPVRVPRPGGSGRPRKRPAQLIADRGYSYTTCRRLLRQRRIAHTIPERSDQQAARAGRGPRGAVHPRSIWCATGSATWSSGPSLGSSTIGPSPPATTSCRQLPQLAGPGRPAAVARMSRQTDPRLDPYRCPTRACCPLRVQLDIQWTSIRGIGHLSGGTYTGGASTRRNTTRSYWSGSGRTNS